MVVLMEDYRGGSIRIHVKHEFIVGSYCRYNKHTCVHIYRKMRDVRVYMCELVYARWFVLQIKELYYFEKEEKV